MASDLFLAPNEAAPPKAPKPTALPLAISAGSKAAKGKMPPFCFFLLLEVLLPLRLIDLLRLW